MSPTPPPHNASMTPDSPRTAMAKLNQFPPPVAIDPVLVALDESNSRRRHSPSPQPGEVRRRAADDDGQDEHELFPPSLSAPGGSSRPLAGAPVRTNLEAYARTLATSKRRKTDHTTQLVDFAKMSPEERQVWLADRMLAIDEKLEKEQSNVERSFTLSDATKTNAKKYIFSLLMSPLLPAFIVTVDDIMKVLADRGVYPSTWNPYQLQVLQSHALDYATTKRFAIKDRIKLSIQNNEYLDALCLALVGKSGLKVTPGMRARIAFVRFTYAHNPEKQGNTFWDFVDEELKKLRDNTKGSADHLQYCMNNYARGDETAYTNGMPEPGKPVKYKIVTDESKLPEFQRLIAKAAAGFIPMASGPPAAAPAAATAP